MTTEIKIRETRERTGWRAESISNKNWGSVNKPSSDGHYIGVKIDRTQPLNFTDADALYLGRLLLFDACEDIRSIAGVTLTKTVKQDILSLVNRLSLKDINIEKYFKTESMDRIAEILTRFTELDLDECQAFLKTNPNAAVILGPVSHLSLKELGFWHRVSHNDFVTRDSS